MILTRSGRWGRFRRDSAAGPGVDEGLFTTHLRPPEVISGMAEKGVIRPITDACTYGEVAPFAVIPGDRQRRSGDLL